MVGKILVVIFAFAAGAAGAMGFELINKEIAKNPVRDNIRLAALEEQLGESNSTINELEELFALSQTEKEVLVSRINSLSTQVSNLQEKRGEFSLAESENTGGGAPGIPGEANESDFSPKLAEETATPISGRQLVAALKEMPEEGKQMIRKAIYSEVQRIRQEEANLPERERERLEKKVGELVRQLTPALDLSPVQVEELRGIGARAIEAILEVNQVARQRNDPGYAHSSQKQIENDARHQIVDMLTPEQLDRLRELDPDGIGKEYPRGF